jgi:hypothetical protein
MEAVALVLSFVLSVVIGLASARMILNVLLLVMMRAAASSVLPHHPTLVAADARRG